MKGKLFLVALLVAVVGFSACGGGDKPEELSSECKIISFKDGNIPWEINENNRTIIGSYDKGSTTGTSIAPTIVTSTGATVVPQTGATQDFSGGKTVTYTVTAENKKDVRSYTASIIVK